VDRKFVEVLVDGDVSKRETAIEVVDAAIKHFGRIDLLVNNAGIYMPKAFTDYTEEDYNLVMNTNVAGFFYMTQQVIPQMKKQNSGHVVSFWGFRGPTERRRDRTVGRAVEIADAGCE
jgi:NADP-dependent 3-hydroxy acid dehydrogenase YdfG